MNENINILVVGNDPIIIMSTCRVLKAEGYNVEGVQSTKEAMHRIKNNNYTLVLTDLTMLKAGGISLIQLTTQCRPAVGIVVVAGDLLQETIQEALQPGIKTHTMRPFIPPALKDAIQRTTEWMRIKALENGRGEEFAPAGLAELDTVIHQYKGVTSSAIPVLLRAQEIFGYLPPGIQGRIAKGLNIYPSEISSIASFYSCFRTEQGGNHTIKICRGYSCYLKGSEGILSRIKETLKIGVGDTTRNREFTLEDVHCVGACNNAPVMVIDRETYGEVNRKKATKLIARYTQKADRMHRKRVSVQPSDTGA